MFHMKAFVVCLLAACVAAEAPLKTHGKRGAFENHYHGVDHGFAHGYAPTYSHGTKVIETIASPSIHVGAGFSGSFVKSHHLEHYPGGPLALNSHHGQHLHHLSGPHVKTVYVTVPKPVYVAVKHPVPVPVKEHVPVIIHKPYPVNINRPVPVAVPRPVEVKVPVPVPVAVGVDSGHGHHFGSVGGAGIPVGLNPPGFGTLESFHHHGGNYAGLFGNDFGGHHGYAHGHGLGSSFGSSSHDVGFSSSGSEGYSYPIPSKKF